MIALTRAPARAAQDLFVSASVLERYGAALVAGMRLWQEYIASLAVVSPPPLPSPAAELAADDCARLDDLMSVLARVCELAAARRFDVAVCLVDAATGRRAALWSPPHLTAALESRLPWAASRAAPAAQMPAAALPRPPASAEEILDKAAAFHRAIGVAYIATCLARAFAEPDPTHAVFPSVLLSGETTREMHAVDLLAEHTFVKLSLRLAPSAGGGDLDAAARECSTLAPAVLSVAGLQRVPECAPAAAQPVLEYTRGIGDLQTSRLREAAAHALRAGRCAPHALVQREFAGARNRLYAAVARTPLARTALQAESRALWTRVGILLRRAFSL